MAQIIGQQEQQSALKEIKAALKEMESTNLFLEHKNESGKYTILFTAPDGTRCRAIAYTEKREEIDRLVLHHKQLVSEQVQELATAHRIALDLDEKLTLNLDLTPEEQEILDARALAELEQAEQAAAGEVPHGDPTQNSKGQVPSSDRPFYPSEDDVG